ncbi:MAG TPA: ABC transporter substrate-binding protein [Micropepsaceae bacterium]|nr:ABC transporter substrate-binding protein [Micropepsaceae bacterium]
MKRFLLAIIAAALLGFSLSPVGAAEKVRVAMPTEGFLYTPLYLAIDAGFMKDEGLEPELIQFKGGGAAMGGLVSGSVEFCSCAIQNAINATVKGSGVTLIGTIIGQYASNMVLREDVAKRLGITHDTPIRQRLAALRGLKIAGSGVGSSTDFLIRYLAKQAGLSPERDFTVLFLADGGPILAAFSQKRIDGFVFSSPTSDMAILKYKGVMILDMSRGEFDDLRGYPSITLSAKTSWLKTKPDTARRFLRALARADRMIHAEPARAQALLRKRFETFPDDIYKAAWAANIAAYPQNPRIEEVSVERAIAFLSSIQDVKIPGIAKDYFDDSYADEAVSGLR